MKHIPLHEHPTPPEQKGVYVGCQDQHIRVSQTCFMEERAGPVWARLCLRKGDWHKAGRFIQNEGNWRHVTEGRPFSNNIYQEMSFLFLISLIFLF